ncbi:substrate-binding periplasmic protein [Alkalimarinus coralli]|uniref:substrate-binding periplasmic protein n=1 Tax=Alkalimarinus coralli TaxID=2935863 RepID=UPI00202B1084|nr:transporter substrate-binding domain-containing protein [Alkalimarinus coralli]
MHKHMLISSAIFACGVMLGLLTATHSMAFDKEDGLKAVTLEYPPYEFADQGEPSGLAVEIVKEAIKRTGVNTIHFEFHPWNWAVSMTKSGKADMLFNAGRDREREQWGHYVDSVLVLQQYYLFKSKDDTTTINANYSNVHGKSIAVRLGYLYGNGAFKRALSRQFKKVVYSYSTEQSVNLLLKRRVDFFVGDYTPVIHYLREKDLLSDIDIVKQSESSSNFNVLTWPTYIIFSKKNVSRGYVDEVHNALEEMKLDGTYNSILETFGYPYQTYKPD